MHLWRLNTTAHVQHISQQRTRFHVVGSKLYSLLQGLNGFLVTYTVRKDDAQVVPGGCETGPQFAGASQGPDCPIGIPAGAENRTQCVVAQRIVRPEHDRAPHRGECSRAIAAQVENASVQTQHFRAI